MSVDDDVNAAVGDPAAQVAIWGLIALANSCAVEVLLSWSPIKQRLVMHVVDLGQLLGVGVVVAVACWTAQRFIKASRVRLALLGVVVFALAMPTIPLDIQHWTTRVFPGNRLVLPVIVLVLASMVPFAASVGALVDRRWWRWLAVGMAWGAALANSFVLYGRYVHLHAYIMICSAALGGSALSTAVLPQRLRVPVRWTSRAAIAVVAFVCVGSLALANRAICVPLTHVGGTPQVRLVLRMTQAWRGTTASAALAVDVSPEEEEWFENRLQRPSVPAGAPIVNQKPMVVFITVDSLRRDVLSRPDLAPRLPFFQSLDERALRFDRAWAAGPATQPSLVSIFTSRYASQLLWTPTDIFRVQHDDSPRFPGLLTAAGVTTLHFVPWLHLLEASGIVRGFGTEVDLVAVQENEGAYVQSPQQLRALKEHLLASADGPVFAFAHVLDAHSPYTDADDRPADSDFEHYLQELEVVDGRLGELVSWVERQTFADRTVLIVSADHGEAFGEHGTKYHGDTLYEEALAVPLWILAAGVEPRRVQQVISLVDVAPTVLDLFGVATPGTFMGQSLVPFMRGETPKLHRPIVADSRQKRAMLADDGWKVIRDLQLGTVEVYDLSADPHELVNLADEAPPHLLQRMDAFFAAHLHKAYARHPPLGY